MTATKGESASHKAGQEAVREKVDKLRSERAALKAGLRENAAAFLDAAAAGRLFGVEIELPPDVRIPPVTRAPAEPEPRQGTLFEAGGHTIRDAVLEQLRLAGKRGMKATPLREIIEPLVGRKLHYKTIGMTLYRLSQRGFVRRDGVVWYHVTDDPK